MRGDKCFKLLQVVRDIEGTGGGNIVINTSRFVSGLGHDVVVLTDVPYLEFEGDNIKLVSIPFGSTLYNWQAKGKLSRTLRHAFQILNFLFFTSFLIPYFKFKGFKVINNNNEAFFGDIILVHNVFSAEVFGHEKGFLRGGLRLLNPVMLIRVLKEQLVLRFKNNSLIVANSNETKTEISKYLGRKNGVFIIPSGVDIEKYQCPDSLENTDEFALLFVGHEFERKGLAVLINSLLELPEQIVLKVVGGRGSSINIYQNLVDEQKLQHRVSFLGSVSKLEDAYLSSNLFVLPSIYEGLPLVCLESMASGLPNLVTHVGGMKDLVIDRQNGFFVERDSKSIADKVLELYSNPELYQAMRNNARATALDYSWENIGQQYVTILGMVSNND
jgi:glycosyltransferase involved in cell wall biosynthesis